MRGPARCQVGQLVPLLLLLWFCCCYCSVSVVVVAWLGEGGGPWEVMLILLCFNYAVVLVVLFC